ncbi:TonB-dependent receptor [Pseudomonadales bacterium]|nr:TonB-dependent receptor [Pseudomonadales bacterium]
MSIKQNKNKDLCFTLKTSVMASCLLVSLPVSMANAQDNNASADGQQIQEVVVEIGILGSILRSLREKRNADQIKDVISAEDIGKLPDQNLAEALQRITGVQISRDFGDGSEVAVRGLSQNRVEINGQSAMGSDAEIRSINFNDLAPDAFKSIEVVKTPTASMTEGSIGGTIRLNTRRAFDSRGRVLSGRIQGEIVENSDAPPTPTLSLFASDRWDTDVGEMGLTTNITYNKQIRVKDLYEVRWKNYTVGDYETTNAKGIRSVYSGDYISARLLEPESSFYAPQQIQFKTNDREQERIGITSGFQWRYSDALEFYIDGNYNAFDISTASNTIQATMNSNETQYTNSVLSENNTLLKADVSKANSVSNGWGQESDRTTWGITLGGEYEVDQWIIKSALGHSRGETEFLNSFFSTNIDGTCSYGRVPVSFSTIDSEIPSLTFKDCVSVDEGWGNGQGVELTDIDTGDVSNYKIGQFSGLGLQTGVLKNKSSEFKLDFTFILDAEHLSSIQFGTRAFERKANRIKRVSGKQEMNGPNILEDSLGIQDARCTTAGNCRTGKDFYVINYPTLSNRMISFPEDYLEGYTGGPENFLGPFNGDFWLNPEVAENLWGYDVNTQPQEQLGYSYEVKEKTLGAYFQLNFESFLLNTPYAANIGLRYVETDVESGAYPKLLNEAGRSDWLVNENDYSDLLASANIGFALTDTMLLRFAIADVMARPNTYQLSSAVNVNTGDKTGRAGNPFLEPFRARQYDIAFEWYATDTDYLSIALFYKDIETFVVQTNEETLVVPYTGGEQEPYDIAIPKTLEVGKVEGVEIGFTKTFGFLGEKLDGLGLTASYTYANSETQNPALVTGDLLPLEDLSKDSYNLITFYEYGKISTRMAYNWRSGFLDKTQGRNLQPQNERDRSQLDFSARYQLTKKISINFNAINIMDDANNQYGALEEQNFSKTSVGRRYTLGLSARL